MEAVSRQRPRLVEYINQKELQATEIRRQITETKAGNQPAQYYFPSDIRKESDLAALNDEDREAVKRMFQFVFKVVESLGGQFQLIITEHADLQDDRYQAVVVERWRGKDKLIPENWYTQQSPSTSS